MVKAHKIGDSVRIDSSEFPYLGLPDSLATETLKVSEFLPNIQWLSVYEVTDSHGNTYGLLESSLVAA